MFCVKSMQMDVNHFHERLLQLKGDIRRCNIVFRTPHDAKVYCNTYFPDIWNALQCMCGFHQHSDREIRYTFGLLLHFLTAVDQHTPALDINFGDWMVRNRTRNVVHESFSRIFPFIQNPETARQHIVKDEKEHMCPRQVQHVSL